MSRVVVVVQARLSSSRLPAKVLLDLGGVTALERCLRRVRRFRGVTEVVLATSDQPGDEIIASVGRRLGHRVVRGSEGDVLSRFQLAASESKADVVVRCTSDCPLLDPETSSRVIDEFLSSGADYAANVLERRYPRGLDTEVFTRVALERAAREATSPSEREHVTPHFYRNPDLFRLHSVRPQGSEDLSMHRWTLDTLDDYRFLYAVFEKLGERADIANITDIVTAVNESGLRVMNEHVEQKR